MKINVKGVIVPTNDKWVYEWFGMEAVCPKDICDALATANGEDIEVVINSGGGEVYAGSEIYTELKGYEGKVTTKIVGVAASSASVIAMAGDNILISPTGQIMIHNVWTNSKGDYRVFEHEAKVLKDANKSIANAYMLKTGMSQEELLSFMDDETWLTAQEAKEKGFADEIMFDDNRQLAASTNMSGLLPPEVINKMRNQRQKPADKSAKLAKARLNFLKLKGETKA
jgi:ATP-dependent protease ClpP protease subunit